MLRYFTCVNENDTHTFCNTCFQEKMFRFRSDFHLDLFIIVRSTISQHEHCLVSDFPTAVIHMMSTRRYSKHMKIHNGSRPYRTFWLHAVPNSYRYTKKHFPLVSHFSCIFSRSKQTSQIHRVDIRVTGTLPWIWIWHVIYVVSDLSMWRVAVCDCANFEQILVEPWVPCRKYDVDLGSKWHVDITGFTHSSI